ncbi:MAG TPA: GtrA family protein [Firmicutes bacterium]|jgi:putative flippase GtrA|nr:GtrA family protein [Bacillota bacterium]
MEQTKRRKEIFMAIKYLLFAISAGVVEILSFTLFTELTDWTYWPSYLIALTLSVVWNFTFNRRYTFKSANNVPLAMFQVVIFYAIFTPVSTILGEYLVKTLNWNEYFVTAINMVANFILEFLYQRFYVFRKSIDTNKLAKNGLNDSKAQQDTSNP